MGSLLPTPKAALRLLRNVPGLTLTPIPIPVQTSKYDLLFNIHETKQGLAATLERKRPDRIYERTLDGRGEASLVALACAVPPDGQAQWSLRLLADELVRLEVVETISYETVRRTLKKTIASRG